MHLFLYKSQIRFSMRVIKAENMVVNASVSPDSSSQMSGFLTFTMRFPLFTRRSFAVFNLNHGFF